MMSRSIKEQVEAYWAGQLAQHEVFRSMLRATEVELVERRPCDSTPDALFNVSYRDGGSKNLWCEMTGAWRSRKDALEVFEIAEGKRNPPTQSHGIMREPDKSTANTVTAAIMRKLEKDSHREWTSKYGLGHLHVYISSDYYPLFGEDTLSRIHEYMPTEDLEDQSIFQSVSLGYRDDVFCLWKNSQFLDQKS